MITLDFDKTSYAELTLNVEKFNGNIKTISDFSFTRLYFKRFYLITIGELNMKILSYILGGFVALIIILAIISPKEFKLEREVIINQPKNVDFTELRILKNHEQWNAWSKKDPQMKKQFKGTDGKVGFISSWESEHPEVGTAEQEITNIVDGERLDTQIRFQKPFEGSFNSYITTQSVNEKQTKVLIGMSDKMSFPMTVISFIVNDCFDQQQKIIQNLDDSLNNLKDLLEK